MRDRLKSGADFVCSAPLVIPALWGVDGRPAWTDGESLMIVGPDGVGKTTVAQQLIRARLGLRSEVLGMPVVPTSGRIVYLAMDRPKQAARSLRRMVTDEDLEVLQERLIVWEGPTVRLPETAHLST